MKKYLPVIFCLAFLLLTANAQSQTRTSLIDDSLNSAGYRNMTDMKHKIATLLQENERLMSEYNLLSNKYKSLISQINRNDEYIGSFDEGKQKELEDQRKRKDVIHELSGEYSVLQDNLIAKESKVLKASAELLDVEDQVQLRELQMADLEYQKRQLEMELKYRKYLKDEEQAKYSEKISKIKSNLNKYLAREQALIEKIKKQEDQDAADLEKLPQLRNEIEELKIQLEEVERKSYFKSQEVKILEDKKKLKEHSVAGVVKEKKTLKKLLSDDVNRLAQEYQEIDSAVEESLEHQKRKKELIKDVIRIDQENQQLRQQILDLEENISFLAQ